MARPWREVAQHPEFKALSPDQQEAARNQYFSEVVAPNVPTEDIASVRVAFDSDTKPTLIGSIIDAMTPGPDKSVADLAKTATPQSFRPTDLNTIAQNGVVGDAYNAVIDERYKQLAGQNDGQQVAPYDASQHTTKENLDRASALRAENAAQREDDAMRASQEASAMLVKAGQGEIQGDTAQGLAKHILSQQDDAASKKLSDFNKSVAESQALRIQASGDDENALKARDQLNTKYNERANILGKGDSYRGARAALLQMPQLAYGLEAGAGAVAEHVFGKGGLPSAIKQVGINGYNEWGDRVRLGSKDTDSVSFAYDKAKQGDYGALVDWLQYGLGYAGGQMGTLLATGGAGGAVMKAGAGVAATEALAKGMIAKESARILEQQAGRKLTEAEIATATKAAGSDLAKAATANVAANLGQTAIIGAQAFGMEGGEIFGDMVSKAQQEGRDLTGADLARGLYATGVAGLLEFAGDRLGFDVLLGKSSIVNGMVNKLGAAAPVARAAVAGGVTGLAEAGTEASQTVAEEMGKGHNPFTEDGIKNIIDSAALGFVGGAAVGGVGGAMHQPDAPLARPTTAAAVQSGTQKQGIPAASILETPEPFPNAAPGSLASAANIAAKHGIAPSMSILSQPQGATNANTVQNAAASPVEMQPPVAQNDGQPGRVRGQGQETSQEVTTLAQAAGTSSTATIPAEQLAPPTQNAGHAHDIVLPDNTTLPAQWEVVDADQVSATLKEGKNQPRDRSRAASNVQVQGIANNPNYSLLRDSPVMDFGAPTLSQEGAIVGGNGRFEGVSRAYDQGTAGEYRTKLEADAASKGIDPASFSGMKKPVLVRRITRPFDTRALAVASNSGGSLQYSALEQAKIDGDRMQGLGDIEVNDTGDVVMSGDNMQNVRRALGGYTAAELGSLTDKDGMLSQEGIRRIKNALLYKAYGNSSVLSRLVESADPDLKSVMGALVRAAGTVAGVRADMHDGNKPASADIIGDLLAAVEQLAKIKAQGVSVEQHLAQNGLFGKDFSDESAEILRFLNDNIRSQKRMAEFIRSYYDGLAQEDHLTGSMFDTAPATNKERLGHAIQTTKQANPESERPGGEARSQAGQQPESAQEPSGGGTQGQQDTSVGTKSAPAAVETHADLKQAEQNVDTSPTDAQKEAGNYAKAHIVWNGLDITIENPSGSNRSGKDSDGESWSVTMPASYGYIKRTEGADGDHIDVYLGKHLDSDKVFIVDQIDIKTGKFDEHKVMLGFTTLREAERIYKAGFSDKKGAERMGAVTPMSLDEFKEWVKTEDTTKPVADAGRAKAQADMDAAMAEMGAILRGMGNVAYIVPEDHQKLLPVLVKMFDAAFRLGYYEMKDATRYVREQLGKIDAKLGKFLPKSLMDQAAQQAHKNMPAGFFDNQGLFAEKPVLETYTNADILKREAAAKNAEEEARKDATAKNVTADQADLFNTHDSLFSSNREQPAVKESLTAQPETGDLAAFKRAADTGKLHQATGKTLPGEDAAINPVEMGRINGYPEADIMHFYAKRRGYGRDGNSEKDNQIALSSGFGEYQADLKDAQDRVETGNSPVESSTAQAVTVKPGAQPTEQSKQSEIVVKQPYGVNVLGKLPEFERAREIASSAERGTIVRVKVEKEGLYEGQMQTLYGAFVGNGDGTATWAQATFPASKDIPSDAQITELAEDARLREAERADKVAEHARKNKEGIAQKGIAVGMTLDKPQTYVEGKPGLVTFSRAKVVAIDDHGVIEVHATLPGAHRQYRFKVTAESRLFEKLESNAEEQKQSALSAIKQSDIPPAEQIKLAADLRKGNVAPEDVQAVLGSPANETNDAGSIWDGMTPSQRFSMLDKWAGTGQTDMGERYKDRKWASFNVGEQNTLRTVIAKSQNKSVGKTGHVAGAETSYADRIHTLAVHDDVMKRVGTGDISAAEFKAAFDSLVKNKEGILAELEKFTKPQLFDKFPGIAYRYKNEKKADAVDAAYRDMLSDFTLGEAYSYGMGRDSQTSAIRALVGRATDESLAEFADGVKKRRAEREARKAADVAGMENPQTLDDYKRLMSAKAAEIGSDATFRQAFMALTPEQRAQYDALAAEQTRGDRMERADQQKTEVRVAAHTTTGDVIETKHTKTGEPLFVVKAAERVERDVYNHWNATAKRLGGWYSSYRGGGAVPGFQFKTRENADAFLSFIGGNVEQAKEAVQARRDAYADDRSQTAVERLTEMAAALDERADEILGQERKVNTARRARFAASAEAAANADKAMAQTMRNIAQGINDGTAKLLDRVRQKAQVEMLNGFVTAAHGDMQREKYKTYAEQERHRGEKPTKEVADYVTFPTYTAYRSDLASLGRALLEVEGTKLIGQRLMKVADDVSDTYLKFAKENLHKVSSFKMKDGGMAVFPTKGAAEQSIAASGYRGTAIVLPLKRGENIIILSPSEAIKRGVWDGDNDKRITLSPDFGAEIVEKLGKAARRGARITAPWQFENAYDKRKRLAGMGIETPAELRAAVREFIGLRQAAKAPDKVKELERAMIGRKNDGLDFFPTPASVADEMIEAAGLEEGMSVLEPSAGMGHIADRIREAGFEPDVIELSGDRRELLEAKGYAVVGSNFMDMTPRDFTYGDVFKAPDGTLGVMRGSGGMGSSRVGFHPLDESGNPDARRGGWYDRDELVGVEKRASNSGYDRILMNPPFGDRRDAEHVRHAFDLLKPGGRLVAIMGEGVFFGQDKKAQEFRDWLESVGGTDEKLEQGTFMDPSLPVNTGVSARMVVIDKAEIVVRSAAEGGPLPESDQLSAAQIAQVLEERLAQFAHQPKVLIRDTERDVLGGASRNDGIATSGMVYKGDIYLFRDGLPDTAAVSRTVWHELLHYGLRRFLTKKQYISKLNRLYMQDGWIMKQANAWLATDQGKAIAAKDGNAYARARGVDEALADLAESSMGEYQNNGIVAKAMRTVARWVAKLADTFGFKEAAARWNGVTNDEARDLVRSMFSKLKNDEPATSSDWAFTADPAFMVAWHGSPHDHDKFDSAKIGTGEGAQAYGFGHYFASNRKVAEWYRGKLSDPAGTQGWHVEQNDEGNWVVYTGDDEVVSAFDTQEEAEALIEEKPGRLYQVELAPAEDEYLLWDKPLSEQSEKVKVALGVVTRDFDAEDRLFARAKEMGVSPETMPEYARLSEQMDDSGRFSRESGEGMYRNLTQDRGSDKAASEYLLSLGIRGIKYLDGSSRNRPLREVEAEFLAELPEDAEIDEVQELIGTGKFSPKHDALLKALAADEWLGFDYPAQAITAALGKDFSNYDQSQELRDAVAEAMNGGTYNYVIFDEDDVSITAKFSRSTKGRGLSVDAVKAIANPIAEKLKNVRTVKVVRRQYEIQGLKEKIDAAFSRFQQDRTQENLDKYLAVAKDNIEGAYVNGELYLVASNLKSAARVTKVLRHEVAHLSVEQMLEETQPGLYKSFLQNVIMLDKAGNKYIRELAKAVDATQPGLDKKTRAAEIIAQIAERGDHDKDMPNAVRSLWQRMMDGIKAFYKLVFGDTLNDQDVRDIVAQSFRWARGEGDAVRVYGGGEEADVRASRGEVAPESFARMWIEEFVADNDAAFKHKVSASRDLKTVLDEVARAEYAGDGTRADERDESGADERRFFTTETGHSFQVFETSGEVWIDVSKLEPGSGGQAIYAAVANYAYNAGKKFVGDPNGLSTAAIIRRTSNMLSSALRFGTTRHLEPARQQLYGEPENGIPKLVWRGSEVDRIEALAQTLVETTQNLYPEIKRWRYDFDTQTFRDGEGKPISAASLSSIRQNDGRGVDDSSRLGEGTARRVVLLQSLVSEGGKGVGRRSQILEQLLRWGNSNASQREGGYPDNLTRLFSRRETAGGDIESSAVSILRKSNKNGIESDTGLIDKAFRAPFKLVGWDRIVSPGADAVLIKIGDLLPETVKAGIVDNYGLDAEYIDSKADMKAREAAMNRKTHGMVEMLAGLTRAESRIAYQWMQTKPDAATERVLLEQLPESSRDTLKALKKLISDLGREAVRLGQMSADAYDRNNMAYLHRTYAKHVLAEDGWLGNYLRARAAKIKGNQYKGRGIFDEVAMSMIGGETLHRKMQAGKADKQLVGEKVIRLERRDASGENMDPLPGMSSKPLGKLRDLVYWPASEQMPAKYGDWVNAGEFEVRNTKGDKLVLWRDLTAEERQRLGELDEVRYAVAQTLQMMVHDIEVGRFLEWTASKYGKGKPEGKEVSASESMLRAYHQEEWVQVPSSNIPGTQTKKYGALAGVYVPGSIFNDIRQTAGIRIEPFGKTYASVLRFWKKSKTVWSPTVHMNNVMANFVMADWNDVRAVDLADALRVWARNDKPGYKELFDRFQDSGALGGMFQSNEVMRDQIKARLEELKTELTGEQEASKELGTMAKVLQLVSLVSVKPVKGYAAVTAKAYQGEDEFFRLAVFLKAIRHGKTDIEAGRMARHAFLNYDINAPWVQYARQTFLPFVSFFYCAAPLLLNTAKNKPWKIAKLVAFAYMVNALGYALAGGGDEDKDRKLMPDEKSGSVWGLVPKMIRMPWNHTDGSPVFLDIRRWVPVGDIADMEMGSGAMPPWATPSGPLVTIGEAFLLNKSMFTEKEIVGDMDTATERFSKRTDYLFKSMMPNVPVPNPINLQIGDIDINPFNLEQGSLQSYSWSGIEKAVNRTENTIGEVKTVPAAIASAFGIKVSALPPDNMEAALKMDFKRKHLAVSGEISKAVRNYSKLDNPTAKQTAILESDIEAQIKKIEKAGNELLEKLN